MMTRCPCAWTVCPVWKRKPYLALVLPSDSIQRKRSTEPMLTSGCSKLSTEIVGQVRKQLSFRLGADDVLDRLAVLEDNQSRN